MRRYTLEVNGKTYTFDVDELAADRFVVTDGEQTYEVRLAGDEDLPGAIISPLVEPGPSRSTGPRNGCSTATRSPATPLTPQPPLPHAGEGEMGAMSQGAMNRAPTSGPPVGARFIAPPGHTPTSTAPTGTAPASPAPMVDGRGRVETAFGGQGRGAAGAAVVPAPMPGVILEIMAAPGDNVTRGQPVLILEAMKMRNTICAPRDGVIAEVLVQAGQTVSHGTALLRFGETAS